MQGSGIAFGLSVGTVPVVSDLWVAKKGESCGSNE
jgi:hypothetical protein